MQNCKYFPCIVNNIGDEKKRPPWTKILFPAPVSSSNFLRHW